MSYAQSTFKPSKTRPTNILPDDARRLGRRSAAAEGEEKVGRLLCLKMQQQNDQFGLIALASFPRYNIGLASDLRHTSGSRALRIMFVVLV